MADTESKEINVAVPEVEPETTVEPVSQPVVVCEKIQATKPTSVKEETKSENLAKKNGHDKSSEKSNNKSSSQSNKKQKWVNYRKAAKNIKTNYSSLPKSTDHDEIRKQVDFYFSDSNLAYDDFMHSLVVDGRNENKAVPIYKIHTFKRMRRFQPLSVVVEALKGSTVVDVVGDNQDEIRRKVPFKKPETNNEFEDPTITRSIYVKGFGREGSTTQFDIESLFAPYGPVSMVRLRRTYPDRLFKGSVFVEFETDDIQKQFLDLEDKPKWQGKVLDIMSKQSYCEMKLADIDAGKIGPSNKFQFKQYAHPRKFNGESISEYHQEQNRRGWRGNSHEKVCNNRKCTHSIDYDWGNWRNRRDDFQKRDRRDDGAQDDNGAASATHTEPKEEVATEPVKEVATAESAKEVATAESAKEVATAESVKEVGDACTTETVKEMEGSNSPLANKRRREDDDEEREQSPKKAKVAESAVDGGAS